MRNVTKFKKPRRRGKWSRPSDLVPLAVVVAFGGLLAFDNLQSEPTQATVETARSFEMCGRPPHHDCVIDGDTFYLGSDSVRIADIDTPETYRPQCDEEAALGARATRRLLQLLNAGPFALERAGSRDRDRYGRLLRTVVRNGSSLGDTLVSEGLAREWTGRRLPWCD